MKIRRDTNKAFAMLDRDVKKIAPAVDSLRVTKRLTFVNGEVVGTWAYSPSIFEAIRTQHEAEFLKKQEETPKGKVKS